MPAGILNVVQGTVSMTGDALCRHLGIGKMPFTGSTRTGASIMSASAESGVKPRDAGAWGKSPQLDLLMRRIWTGSRAALRNAFSAMPDRFASRVRA